MKLGPYELDQIYTGDARELAKAIPDESVDLIFTDPVYQNIDDYRWLAETAARVLRPNSALLVWFGIGYLDQQLRAVVNDTLAYRWQFIMYYSNQVSSSRVDAGFSKYASLIWLEKGRMKGRKGIDLLPCPVFTDLEFNNGKINHNWSKPSKFYRYILELFDGSIVFDPFTGGGTVPAVCKMLGRHYLAFEIDPDTAERARQRVQNTQSPLFVMQPEQVEMFAEATA